MRKCIRCECEMRENYDVKVEGGAYGLKITKQGIFKANLGKVRVAVCPECGYLGRHFQSEELDNSQFDKLNSTILR